MAALTGQTIASTYPQLLKTTAVGGLSGSPTVVEDGDGTASALSISTGGASVAGTLAASGNFAIDTTKFTVVAASGNTAVAGTFDAAGDFKVNVNKFTVAALTGNTVVAGTFNVSGVAQFSSNVNVLGSLTVASLSPTTLVVGGTASVVGNFDVNNNFTVQAATGNTQVDGTLDVVGTITGSLNGNASTATSAATLTTARTIAISGDVTGTATSFNGSANITIPAAITANSIVDADINSSAAIADTKLATISTAGKVSNSATTATSANTANTIVLRGASGQFNSGAIVATSFSGPLNGTVGATTPNTGSFTTLTSSATATLGPTSLIGLGVDVRGFMNVENNVGIGTIRARDDNHLISIRGLYGAGSYTDVMAFYEFGDFVFFNGGLIGVQTEKLRIDSNGFVKANGSIGRGAPVTKTTDFTVAVNENWIICNKTSTTLVTLPSASTYIGREIYFKNVTANAVNSASSNVVPLAGGAASNQIMPAGAGKWCTVVSDGTNWVIMQAG